MSSSQRAESMNKLLKGFLDSKTILTEFLAGFERALERREEAEDIAAVREILYPTHAITHNPIEQQATQCLTRYAYKKFAAEWREKDAYAIEETTSESAATRTSSCGVSSNLASSAAFHTTVVC